MLDDLSADVRLNLVISCMTNDQELEEMASLYQNSITNPLCIYVHPLSSMCALL